MIEWRSYPALDITGRHILYYAPLGSADDPEGFMARVEVMSGTKEISMAEAVMMISQEKSALYARRLRNEIPASDVKAFSLTWVETLSERGYKIKLRDSDYSVRGMAS